MRVTLASSHRHAVNSCKQPLALLCGLALAALGCQEGAILPADDDLPVAGGNVEGALIRDQYHGSGTVGFAFLPPVATRQPSSTSTFESRLSPEVRLEQLKSDGSVASTVATFTMKRSNSNADDAVRRNVNKEFYVLRLHSNRYNLDPKNTYRVRVLTGGVELGYADLDVVNNQSQANKVDRSQFVPLIRGNTLPIRFRIEKRAVDKDGDGVFDWLDNCPTVKNPPTSTSRDVSRPTARASWRCDPDSSACDPQEQDCNPATFKQPDSDGDGIGDACEMCMPGFSGSPCTDIDECKQQPAACDPLTVCTNTPGSYSCGACPAGYTGDGKTGCKDVDECAGTTPVCDSHVMCTNTPGSYTCGPCPTGFMGDGKTCTPSMTPPPMGGLSLTTVTLPPVDDANYRNGAVTLGWAAPMAGQYSSYQLHCSINALDVSTADRVTQDLWWQNARNVPLPASFAPPANTVTLNLRVGEAANCVLRGVDAQGNLSSPTSSTPVQVPFRQHHIAPTDSGQSAGYDFAPVGDVDGDGVDDLLVGGQGSAYLVFGRMGGLTATAPDVVFASDADSMLGYSVAGIGDFNGDGRNDFAIGAPGYRNSAGRVLVFFGRASRDWPASVNLAAACGADLCFENDATGQALGSVVEPAGDFNGDGANDLVIGALNYPDDATASGRMYILLGKAYEAGQTKSGTFYSLSIATPSSSQLQGFVVTGDNTNLARLGFSVASLGNIDGTPGSELAVSALGTPSTPAKLLLLSGRAYALGSTTGLTTLSLADFGARDGNGTPSGTWFASGAEEQFGYGVYAVGNAYDVPGANKPGVADLVVWSYGDPGFTVYPGDNGFADADKFYVGAASGTMSYLGSSVASSRGRGDLDGDGLSEVCAGGERDPQSGATPGTGQLWYADALASHLNASSKTADTSASTTLRPTTLSSDAGPQVIEFAGDLNGDGKQDLVIGSPNSGNFSGELTVLY